MKINSFTKTELDGSFVYFIFSKELIYIGETQRITFSRWVQHFQKQGTFTKKVNKLNRPQENYFEKINLLSIEIDEIRSDFPELRWRPMTQAVEHAIHEILYKSPSQLLNNYYSKYQPDVERFKIISDTTRTAPRNIANEQWDYARLKAQDVLNQIYNYI